MATSTFDALEASRKLRQAGIDDQHAEAIADQLRRAAGADLDQLATRSDVSRLVTRGEFYRALWIQGVGIVAILTALRWLPIG